MRIAGIIMDPKSTMDDDGNTEDINVYIALVRHLFVAETWSALLSEVFLIMKTYVVLCPSSSNHFEDRPKFFRCLSRLLFAATVTGVCLMISNVYYRHNWFNPNDPLADRLWHAGITIMTFVTPCCFLLIFLLTAIPIYSTDMIAVGFVSLIYAFANLLFTVNMERKYRIYDQFDWNTDEDGGKTRIHLATRNLFILFGIYFVVSTVLLLCRSFLKCVRWDFFKKINVTSTIPLDMQREHLTP